MRRWRRRGLGRLCVAIVIAATAAALDDATPSSPSAAEGSFAARAAAHAVSSGSTTNAVANLRLSTLDWVGGPTTAHTGETVVVYVSTALPPELGTPQSWADYFAGLVHGTELTSLTAYVATHTEVQELCWSEHVVGCYESGTLVTIGESLPWVDREEVASHEYGHHVALNRDNNPWRAVDWGTKRWASLANVCARAANGNVFPGDEGPRYLLNPGEGFAEVYRAANEARSGATSFTWQIVDRSFYPDAAALKAVEQDVLQPWTATAAAVYRVRFTATGKRTWSLRAATPLDGMLTVRLSLPQPRPYTLSLLSSNGKEVLATGLWSSSRQQTLRFTVCGQRSVFVRVTRGGPPGRSTVAVAVP